MEPVHAPPPPEAGSIDANFGEDEDDHDDSNGDTALSKVLDAAADRMMRQQTMIAVEPTSQTATMEILKACPLATVEASRDSGHVLVLVDCNAYGETDVQPAARTCPMGANLFKQWMRSVLEARCGKDEPDALKAGDLFLSFSAGKDRKRFFSKPLQTAKVGKDPERTFVRTFTLFLSEDSYKARRNRVHGHLRLSQQVYMVMSAATLKMLPSAKFPIHGGSNRADVFGPVAVDPLSARTRAVRLAPHFLAPMRRQFLF